MVNIGGFVGPVVAGIVRAMSWEYVFIASAGWMVVNLFIVIFFFKEPETKTEKDIRTLGKVFSDMIEVLGNGRFFLFVFGLLVVLVLGSKYTSDGSFTWNDIILISIVWVILNFLYDFILKMTSKNEGSTWLATPMKLGDWRFGLFLLLMSGFWTSFNQIFYTLPLYIRDFTDTTDLLNFIGSIMNFVGLGGSIEGFKNSLAVAGQVNPEYIININAGAIIFFQVGVSYFVTKLKPFTTIFWGVMITVVSFSILVFGTLGWIVVIGVVVFSFGEMMASPKSKEYTGKIAPPDKVAMYMGYFYWCVALGNLFGGILSGQLYAAFARDMQRPDLMWITFAVIAVITALLILTYDKLVIKKK